MSVCPGSTVFPALIVLRLREAAGGKTENLILLPDQMTRDEFRKLQIRLRWH